MTQHAYCFLQYRMAAPTKMIHSVAARANVVRGIPLYNKNWLSETPQDIRGSADTGTTGNRLLLDDIAATSKQ